MHFCMDELRMIVAGAGVLAVAPYICRCCWYKVKWWLS